MAVAILIFLELEVTIFRRNDGVLNYQDKRASLLKKSHPKTQLIVELGGLIQISIISIRTQVLVLDRYLSDRIDFFFLSPIVSMWPTKLCCIFLL